MFAVQNGGWCAASASAPQTYDKYGKSTACKFDGEGGPWANNVYFIKGKSNKSYSLYWCLTRALSLAFLGNGVHVNPMTPGIFPR